MENQRGQNQRGREWVGSGSGVLKVDRPWISWNGKGLAEFVGKEVAAPVSGSQGMALILDNSKVGFGPEVRNIAALTIPSNDDYDYQHSAVSRGGCLCKFDENTPRQSYNILQISELHLHSVFITVRGSCDKNPPDPAQRRQPPDQQQRRPPPSQLLLSGVQRQKPDQRRHHHPAFLQCGYPANNAD